MEILKLHPFIEQDILITPASITDETYREFLYGLLYLKKKSDFIEIWCSGTGGKLNLSLDLHHTITEMFPYATTRIKGEVHSGHTCIFLAGSRRLVSPYSVFGIHQAMQYKESSLWFGVDDARCAYESLVESNLQLSTLYAQYSNLDEQVWGNKLKQALYETVEFRGEEIINLGFANGTE